VPRSFILFALLIVLLPLRAWAVQDVANTRHNLSTSGPGSFKSENITQVCVFCHTPHNATPDAPLWNRTFSTGQTYLPYDSTTLQATPKPDQPTGRSRLCLSCHDGTVALGALVNPPTGVVNDMAGELLTGRGALGTDLKDDHPISFNYDADLVTADGELVDPATCCDPDTPGDLPLENTQIQCTSCHDPHEATLAPFMRRTVLNGALCTSCHDRKGPTGAWDWDNSSHATSVATPTSGDPWGNRRAEWQAITTVAEGACLNCHTPHNAAFAPPRPPRLLKDQEENTCFLCHDGTVTTHSPARDVAADFIKGWTHPVETTPNADHDASLAEDPLTMPLHVECPDCHNPHAVADAPPMISFNPSDPVNAPHSIPPAANARIRGGVTGVDINGDEISYDPTAVKEEIDFLYELCFKCHGLGQGPCGDQQCGTTLGRQHLRLDHSQRGTVGNIRERVNPATPGLLSYHPFVQNDPNNNVDGVPSLRQDLPVEVNDVDALMYCTDCHNSDVSAAAGGTGASGPHGSNWEGLMAQQYTFNTDPSGAIELFAVCYKCHDEGRLTSNLSGFNHQGHIGARGGACIDCHGPHGSFASTRLINFLWEADGIFVVDCYDRDRKTGVCSADEPEPRWGDGPTPHTGECWITCHGSSHSPKTY
jgi:predicted CXXCH cytochrome family protein